MNTLFNVVMEHTPWAHPLSTNYKFELSGIGDWSCPTTERSDDVVISLVNLTASTKSSWLARIFFEAMGSIPPRNEALLKQSSPLYITHVELERLL